MLDSFLEYLKETECNFTEYKDLATVSCIGIGAVARLAVYPDETEKLVKILKKAKELSVRYFVIGRMSNVLFKNKIFDGVLIKTDKISGKTVAEDEIEIECGATLAKTATELAMRDLGGFEGLMGIPGSIGGMIRQNAGAFGYEISDRCTECLVYNVLDDRIQHISRADMHFGYRTSILENRDLILLSATFSPLHKSQKIIFQEIEEYSDMRKRSQPIRQRSLGSVFKRVDGISAGYYIDRSGLKGVSVGGAEVSQKHAGFIVNTGSATADDVLSLIGIVKQRVFDKFGIILEEEIEII